MSNDQPPLYIMGVRIDEAPLTSISPSTSEQTHYPTRRRLMGADRSRKEERGTSASRRNLTHAFMAPEPRCMPDNGEPGDVDHGSLWEGSSVDYPMETFSRMPDDSGEPFITFCCQQQCFDYALLAAVRFKRLEETLNLMPPDLPWLRWDWIFKHLIPVNEWGCIKKLVAFFPQHLSAELFLGMTVISLNADGQAVFQMLLERCVASHHLLLVEVIKRVTACGLHPQFGLLVYSDNEHVRQAVVDASTRYPFLLTLVGHGCLHRALGETAPGVERDFNECLSVACESGVLEVANRSIGYVDVMHYKAMTTAVTFNQPDMVQFLFCAGLMSNRDVFRLSHHPALLDRLKERTGSRKNRGTQRPKPPVPAPEVPVTCHVDTARQIRQFLADKASQPLSLETLCLREVSKLAGWGHAREAFLNDLELSKTLKYRLRLKGCRALLRSSMHVASLC